MHFRMGSVGKALFNGALGAVTAGLILFALLAFLFVGGHGRALYAESQNFLLKEKLAGIKSEMEKQERSLEMVSGKTLLANLRFGVERPEPTVLARGIGGPVHADSLLIRTIPGQRISHQMTHQMTTMRRGVEESVRQLSDLESIAQQKLLAWRHYPSIRPTTGHVTSPFGQRVHPITGEAKPHEGLDIANVPWTPIVATADGIVAEVSFRPSFYGNFVRIDHSNGYQTFYAHLSQAAVKQGQFIQRHQLLGHMGSTGRVTGCHLHYEVRLDGQPVNPARFILPSSVMVD